MKFTFSSFTLLIAFLSVGAIAPFTFSIFPAIAQFSPNRLIEREEPPTVRLGQTEQLLSNRALRKQEADRLLQQGAQQYRLSQFREALQSWEQALGIYREIGDRAREGDALGNLGNIYNRLGQYQQAINLFEQHLFIAREIGDRFGEGTALGNLGISYDLLSQYQRAISFYIDTVADDYRVLADLLLQQDRVLEAQRILDLLKVQELDDYLRHVRSTAQTETGVILFGPEIEISNKAILIGRQLAQLNAELNLIPLTDWSETQRQQLEALNTAQQAIIDDFQGFIASPEIQRLIAQLTITTREQDLVAELDELVNLQNNLRDLDQNAVMIYPLILGDRLELILVTPFSEPTRYPVQVSRAELNQAIIQFRNLLTSPTHDPKPIAQQLYQWLIEPMAADLDAIGTETILYAPWPVALHSPRRPTQWKSMANRTLPCQSHHYCQLARFEPPS